LPSALALLKDKKSWFNVAKSANKDSRCVARCLQSTLTTVRWFSWLETSDLLYKRRAVLYSFFNTSHSLDRKALEKEVMAASPLPKSSSSIYMALGLLAPKRFLFRAMFCPVSRCDILKHTLDHHMFSHNATKKTLPDTDMIDTVAVLKSIRTGLA